CLRAHRASFSPECGSPKPMCTTTATGSTTPLPITTTGSRLTWSWSITRGSTTFRDCCKRGATKKQQQSPDVRLEQSKSRVNRARAKLAHILGVQQAHEFGPDAATEAIVANSTGRIGAHASACTCRRDRRPLSLACTPYQDGRRHLKLL